MGRGQSHGNQNLFMSVCRNATGDQQMWEIILNSEGRCTGLSGDRESEQDMTEFSFVECCPMLAS